MCVSTMTKTATTTALAALVTLASAPAPVQAQDMGEAGFRRYLAKQYFMLAQGEDQDWDIQDSNYLRDAGVATLNGHPFGPHSLVGVPIVSSRPGELQEAQNFLLNVQANGAAVKMPREFARALSAFDCWVEQQQSEPNASHNTQQCRRIYRNNAELLSGLYSTKTTTTSLENLRTLHSVYFEWDRSDLTADARAKLDRARAMLTDVRNGKLIISGFADASGSKSYNMALSQRRARTVAQYLELPVDRFEIRVRAYGENYLHVPTADGVRKAANRVVDISVNADKVVVDETE